MQPGFLYGLTAAVPAKKPQKVQKQIDKIQVQLEGGEDGRFLQNGLITIEILIVSLDFLHIISSEAQEYHNPHHANSTLHSGKVNEHTQQAGNHQKNQPPDKQDAAGTNPFW